MRIAVIGAGPTGIFATKRLLELGLHVTLIESGNTSDEVQLSKEDYRFLTPSKIPRGVHKLGGGTNFWKGRVSRFPFTALQSFSPEGKPIWPIDLGEIETAYKNVSSILGFQRVEDMNLEDLLHKCPDCSCMFKPSYYQFIKPSLFREMFSEIKNNPRMKFLSETYCEKILVKKSKDNELLTLIFRRKVMNSEITKSMDFDFILLAAGALQSAAIVQRSFPLECKKYPVGKFLQEHFDGYIGRVHFRRKDRDCLSNFVLNENRKFEHSEFGAGIRDFEFGKLHWHLEIAPLARVYTFDLVANRFNLNTRFLKLLFFMERAISGPIFRMTTILNSILQRKTYSLWLKGEELPNEESEVFIDKENPEIVVYAHKLSKESRRQMFKEISKFKKKILSSKFGKISFSPHIIASRKIATGANWHPMGTLRMHASETSVLNPDSSLSFNDRILCLDSSAFPRGAHQNPTAMALTLAERAISILWKRLESDRKV